MFKKFLNRKAELFDQLDPNRIYVENIRSFFNIPFWMAKYFCDSAARQGLYKKRFGVYCNNEDCNRLIEHFKSSTHFPENISCENCEVLGREVTNFKKEDFQVIEFYQLNDNGEKEESRGETETKFI